jgi:hypothetical protein
MVGWWLATPGGGNSPRQAKLPPLTSHCFISLTELVFRCGSWDLRAKPSAPAAQFQHGRSLVTGLELLDPNRLASTSTEGTVCLWDIRGAFWTNQTAATFHCAFCLEAAFAQRVRFVHDNNGTELGHTKSFSLSYSLVLLLTLYYCFGSHEMHFNLSCTLFFVVFFACMLLCSQNSYESCRSLPQCPVKLHPSL